VGTVLPAVRKHTLRYVQGPQPWSTDTPKAPIATPETSFTPVGAGADLAVAVGVAVNPTTAVLAYIRGEGLSVDRLLTIIPAAGADDQAIANAGQAVAYAQTIRDLIREDLENHPDAARIHLFLAGPGGSPCCLATGGTAPGLPSSTSTSGRDAATRQHSQSTPDTITGPTGWHPGRRDPRTGYLGTCLLVSPSIACGRGVLVARLVGMFN